MKKFILSLFALMLFSFMPSSQAKASALGLTALERCCLPVAGRMQKSETASCHCPPERLCPVSIKEWNEAKLLPSSIASICCQIPQACTINRTVAIACGGVNKITEDISKDFCFRYEVKSADYTSNIYKNATNLITQNETRLQAIREEIRVLSRQGASEANYQKGVALLNETTLIEATIQKIIDDGNKADNKLKLSATCQANTPTTCCTSQIAQPCPPVDDPKKCKFWNHEVGDQGSKGWWYMNDEEKAVAIKKCPDYEFVDCVAEGTLVLMADGSQKRIQDVRIGEYVKGYNANNRVTGLSLEEEGTAFLMSINDGKLNITMQHPILTRKGWKAIDPEKVNADDTFKKTITKLDIGDEILIPDEGVLTVTKISGYEGPKVATYNLSVNGDKTFIANGMVIRAFKKNDVY